MSAAYQYRPPVIDQRRSAERTAEQGIEHIEQIWGLSQEIVRLYALGMKEVEIARELGCHPATVSNCVNSKIGRTRILELQGERDQETMRLSTRLKGLRDQAINALERTLDSEDEKVALKAAEAVLNRTGFAPGEQSAREDAHMNDRHIEELKELAVQRGYRREIIDITASEADEASEEQNELAAAEARIV
jgi:predicted transcriptional regulator